MQGNSHPISQEVIAGNINGPAPLYNSRIIKNWVEYLNRFYPNIDIVSLLKYADIKAYELDDEGHWLIQKQINRFHEMLATNTDNPDIAREAGHFSVTSRAYSAVRQYLLSFVSIEKAYAVMEIIYSRFSRAAVLKTKSIGANAIEARITLVPNVVEEPFQCLYRTGSLEAVATLFTGKYANIEHPICLHKGGDCCLYNISWEKSRTFVWKRIRNYSVLLGLIACGLSINFIPIYYWDALVLSYLLMVLGLSLHAEHLGTRELSANISNQGDAANRLLDQINVSYNNALLVQEIGQATSMILDINQLLSFIAEALEKRLDFDRGMIMLSNRERTRLIYTAGYGYNHGTARLYAEF